MGLNSARWGVRISATRLCQNDRVAVVEKVESSQVVTTVIYTVTGPEMMSTGLP